MPGPKIIGSHTNVNFMLGIVQKVLTGCFNEVIVKKDNNTVEKPC